MQLRWCPSELLAEELPELVSDEPVVQGSQDLSPGLHVLVHQPAPHLGTVGGPVDLLPPSGLEHVTGGGTGLTTDTVLEGEGQGLEKRPVVFL